jgi:Bacteriophage Sf6, terminase small subunit-like
MKSNGTPTATVGHNGGPPIDAPARGRGRPSLYTPEVVRILFDRLAAGESLRAMCRDPGLPSKRTVLSWASTRAEFRRQYDIARECGRHTIGDDVLDIADSLHDSPEAIKKARREIDAKKWHLARMTPKRRGPLAMNAETMCGVNIRTNTHGRTSWGVRCTA